MIPVPVVSQIFILSSGSSFLLEPWQTHDKPTVEPDICFLNAARLFDHLINKGENREICNGIYDASETQ